MIEFTIITCSILLFYAIWNKNLPLIYAYIIALLGWVSNLV